MQGELDFVIEHEGNVLPLEIKSGKDYTRHNALSGVMANPDYHIPAAFVFHSGNVSVKEKITYYPIYMMMFLREPELAQDLTYTPDFWGADGITEERCTNKFLKILCHHDIISPLPPCFYITLVIYLCQGGRQYGKENHPVSRLGEKVIENPVFGEGKKHNDFGLGFYCTESEALAKEWAVSSLRDGFANRYTLDTEYLRVLHLNSPDYTILNWIAVLVEHRLFSIKIAGGKAGQAISDRQFQRERKCL